MTERMQFMQLPEAGRRESIQLSADVSQRGVPTAGICARTCRRQLRESHSIRFRLAITEIICIIDSV